MTREEYLKTAGGIILDKLIMPVAGGEKPRFRVSVGLMTMGKRAVGYCFPRSASTDGTNQIFISPQIDDRTAVLAVLTHNLIHAWSDSDHHGGRFRAIAEHIGFRAPFADINATAKLTGSLEKIGKRVGVYPKGRLVALELVKQQGQKRDKLMCDRCGWSCYTTKKHIKVLSSNPPCPSCVRGSLRTNV